MNKKILCIMIIISIISSNFISCGTGDDIGTVKPKDTDTTQTDSTRQPEEPPPPPPQTPSNSLLNNTLKINNFESRLHQIALDALNGKYGIEIQQLLAEEVSRCINEMQNQNILQISLLPDNTAQITIIENKSIPLRLSHTYQKIVQGYYGQSVKEIISFLTTNKNFKNIRRNVQ